MLRGGPAAAAAIESARLNDRSFVLRGYEPARRGQLRFNYAAIPPEGVLLEVALVSNDSVALELVEFRYGLPEVGQEARPAATMASPLGADATAIRIQRRF
jgi:hypothetical protein